MRYSPDGTHLALGFAEKTMRFLDIRTRQVVFKSDDLHPGNFGTNNAMEHLNRRYICHGLCSQWYSNRYRVR